MEIASDVTSQISSDAVVMTVEVKTEDILLLDDAARKRMRRQLRMEYIRNKRMNKSSSGQNTKAVGKRPRQDPVFSFSFPSLDPASSSVEQMSIDSARIRQLKNRESAERSRLKKDDLVDSLTCQVCDFYVQLSDLVAENTWLKNLSDDNSSGFTSCESSVCSSSSCCEKSDVSTFSSVDDSVSSPLSSASSSPYYFPSSSSSCAPSNNTFVGSDVYSPLAMKRVRSCSFESHCSSLSSDSTIVATEMSPMSSMEGDSLVDGGDWWMDEGFDLLLDSFSGGELFA